MIRRIISCCLLSILLISCQGFPVEKSPGVTSISRLSERESALLARDAIQEIISEQLVQVNWLTLKGDLVFAINYATDLNPSSQPDAFSDQFNHVAFIAAKFFHQTDTQAKVTMVMAEDVDFPIAEKNPPLHQVVIEKADISSWVNGETTDAEFVQSWYVVPLEVFPTPG